MQVSRYQNFHIKLTEVELNQLFEALDVKRVYKIGCRTTEGFVSVDSYCDAFGEENRKGLTGALSLSPDAFFKQSLDVGYLLHAKEPYIQVKAATYIETEDGISVGALGADVTFWGITFSFPLLFMNSKEGVVKNVLTDGPFLNVPLFKVLQRWVRKNTRYVTMNGTKTALRQSICE